MLPITILLPLLGARRPAYSLQVSTATFVLSLFVNYQVFTIGPFRLGLDGISYPFFILTTFLMPITRLASGKYTKSYAIYRRRLEFAILAYFSVKDLLSFYVFFERGLPFLFLIVGKFGSSDRVRASFLLFLYTLTGSLFMLLAFLYRGSIVGSYNFDLIHLADIDVQTQMYLFLAIFLAIAIKTPLMPFTRWLPRAHARAPVGGSMALAGLVLKLATYGMLRILLQRLPEASIYFGPFVQMIAVVTLIYASFSTIRQNDFKRLVARSSIAHRAVCVAGIFSNTLLGLVGARVLSIAHGFVSPALFFIVGKVIYDRFHTREFRYYRGLTAYRPLAMGMLFLFVRANAGTPLTANWIGEFLCIAGSVQRFPVLGFLLASSILSSAAYSFWRFTRIAFGTYKVGLSWTADLSKVEFHVLLALLIPTVAFGIRPNLIIEYVEADLLSLLYF